MKEPVAISLRAATFDGRQVELSFDDGRPKQSLSLFWLRDHCQDPAAHHPQTGQRLIDTLKLPPDVWARDVRLEDSGRTLRIDWAHEDRVSRFDAAFLSGLRADPDTLSIDRQLWDHAAIAAAPPAVPYAGLMDDDAALKIFLEKVARYGFCLVMDVPCTPETTRAIGRRIAYLRATVYGDGYWEVTTDNTEGMSLAFSTRALSFHTDGTYSQDPPGYQMFHCLEAASSGGETLLIDGFRVAAEMQRTHPADYHVLTEVPIPAQYVDREQGIHIMARHPLFRLDGAGELVQVSYSNYNRAPFVLPLDRQNAFYGALATFGRICADGRLHYQRLLSPGMLLLLDNWRVLHARAAFSSTQRRLAGAYFNKEDVDSRLRLLRRRAGEAV